MTGSILKPPFHHRFKRYHLLGLYSCLKQLLQEHRLFQRFSLRREEGIAKTVLRGISKEMGSAGKICFKTNCKDIQVFGQYY